MNFVIIFLYFTINKIQRKHLFSTDYFKFHNSTKKLELYSNYKFYIYIYIYFFFNIYFLLLTFSKSITQKNYILNNIICEYINLSFTH